MKEIFTVIIVFVGLTSNAQTFNNLRKAAEDKVVKTTASTGLSEEEIALGLKEALSLGVEKGINQLSKPDGYFKDPEMKIPFPKEVKQVESKLRSFGQGKMVDDAIESLNRAAEDAVVDAKDIFIAAIKNMTLTDAMSILKGEKDAAT